MSFWLGLLPITHDIEEAQDQYDWVASFVLECPELLFSGNAVEAASRIATIFGEAFQEKYFKEGSNTKQKIAQATRFLLSGQNAEITQAFQTTAQSALNGEAQQRVEAAFKFQ